jgi:hypothetical protein
MKKNMHKNEKIPTFSKVSAIFHLLINRLINLIFTKKRSLLVIVFITSALGKQVIYIVKAT